MNRFWKRVASTLRGVSFSFIWGLRLFSFKTFLSMGRFILFPLNAAINVTLIGFTLYELYLNPTKSNIINAAVETLTGIGIVIALIGSLLIGAQFAAIVAPILMAVSFAIRAFKSLLYDLPRHCNTTTDALPNILNFIAGALSVMVIILVPSAEIPFCEIIGVVSGITSAFAAGVLINDRVDKKKASDDTPFQIQPEQMTGSSFTVKQTASVQSGLSRRRSHRMFSEVDPTGVTNTESNPLTPAMSKFAI